MNSTDQVPLPHCAAYGSRSGLNVATGRIVRMKAVLETSSWETIVKEVNRGASKILISLEVKGSYMRAAMAIESPSVACINRRKNRGFVSSGPPELYLM